ncbi:hypothetical protein [Rubrivivax sp. JA1026]|uniref:hypothetical protein n=1 Tax=Rubrivivax sp. JA1026 TaxID=2710888 RepID=UPI0013E954ED|nr:hypothetical protein [Rubrivivax sp. JA1026]
MNLFTIENAGADLKATNYWDSEHASAGFCFLSANAGTWRLLVPEAAEHLLVEMRTGKRATIEPSIQAAGCVDVVFEDGSASPFSIAIDKRQMDRAALPGRCRLAVWTQRGKVLDLACRVR